MAENVGFDQKALGTSIDLSARARELGLLAETAGDEPNVSLVDGRMYEAVVPK